MSDLYLDTSRSPEQRAQALLEELSLPEKMAQVRGIFPLAPAGMPGKPSPARRKTASAR